VHLLGAGLAQRAGAFVHGRAGRIDVVDECEGARTCSGREGAAHVAAPRSGVEASLGAHAARPVHERHDRHLPPADQLGRELGRRIRAAQQQAVSHRRHDGDRLDRWPRQLVRHQRCGQPAGRDLAALPAPDQRMRGPFQPDGGAGRREPAQAATGAACRHHHCRRRPAARAQGSGECAQALPAALAHPVPGRAAGDAATGQQQAHERGVSGHGARLGPVTVACLSRAVPERCQLLSGRRRAGSARTARGARPPR
jgi:hypothetical protein